MEISKQAKRVGHLLKLTKVGGIFEHEDLIGRYKWTRLSNDTFREERFFEEKHFNMIYEFNIKELDND